MTPLAYDTIGRQYVAHRRADPRWEAAIAAQLGPGRSVVNVGAGTGSYEPTDRVVMAVEPSLVMVSQRPPDAAPALRASATALPLGSRCADVAMAVLTVHHWDDWAAGLAELCRVAPRRVVVAIDFEPHSRFWLYEDYLPEVGATARQLGPDAATVADAIGATRCEVLPVPADMEDGVLGRVLVPARGLPRPGGPGQLLRAGAGRPGGRRPWGGRARVRPAWRNLAPAPRRPARARVGRPRVPAPGQRPRLSRRGRLSATR